MIAVYANFFNPQTLSLIFCLNELYKMAQTKQVDMKSDLVKFLLTKILSITDISKTALTNKEFQNQLMALTNNQQFLEKYRNAIQPIDCFNKFYGIVLEILRNLKLMRNSKIGQSNLVNFFSRRLFLYFQKLDFKEIVKIYENFVEYREGTARNIKQHQFMLTKSIEEVKFNLENYSFRNNQQELEQLIEKISMDDHTFKTSYLKGIMYAQQGAPVQSSHFLRRYFDKNVANLFQDRMAEGVSSNKINHCILSGAYAGLQLQHLDQCLQSISQGLRISQNNTDEQSINNCIIYLYHVAERLGKFRQQILLAQHAITHSLNQNNLTLTLYSCLSCSLFQKKYDTTDSSLSLLKTREVSWKDALHFAKKKLHSHYENSCRNIFHLYRNLLIPSFIHKLAILAQIPSLKNLLINPYYNRKELLQLTVYKQFLGQNQLSELLKKAEFYSKMSFQILLSNSLSQLQKMQEICAPFEKIKIECLKNGILLRQGSLTACYNSCQELLSFCRNQGFTKIQYVECLLMIVEILSQNQLLFDALIKAEEAYKLCLQYNLTSVKHYANIVKAQILLKIGHLAIPIETLKQLEEEGVLNLLRPHDLRKFYQTKLLLNMKAFYVATQSIDRQTIHKNILNCYENIVRLCIEDEQLLLSCRWITKTYVFVAKHPVFNSKAFTYQNCEKYAFKIRDTFRKCQQQSMNDQLIAKRAMQKLKNMLVM